MTDPATLQEAFAAAITQVCEALDAMAVVVGKLADEPFSNGWFAPTGGVVHPANVPGRATVLTPGLTQPPHRMSGVELAAATCPPDCSCHGTRPADAPIVAMPAPLPPGSLDVPPAVPFNIDDETTRPIPLGGVQ